MSVMSDIHYDIQEAINEGELTFTQIAVLYGVSVQDVNLIYKEMQDNYDDSMDGDFDSAMASAGWGTDEDYVCDNDYFDNY